VSLRIGFRWTVSAKTEFHYLFFSLPQVLIAVLCWVRTVAAAALATITPAQVITGGKDDRPTFRIVVFSFYQRILRAQTCLYCGCSC